MKKSPTKQWKSKIVGYAEVDPASLTAHPGNPRVHPDPQVRTVEGNIREIGWIQDIIVNKRTGHVIDGHLRIALALKEKQKTVPVKYVSLSKEQEYQALLTLDSLSALAEPDRFLIEAALRECSSGESAVQEFLESLVKSSEPSTTQNQKDLSGEGSDQSFAVLCECESEQQQIEIIEYLQIRGYPCRALI